VDDWHFLDWNFISPRIAHMERLGASIEELADQQLEELLGYNPFVRREPGDTGHKPPRPDIQKMREVRDLWQQANRAILDDSASEDTRQDKVLQQMSAEKEWEDRFGLGEDGKFIPAYNELVRQSGEQQAFESLALFLDPKGAGNNEYEPGKSFSVPSDEGKKRAGELLKRNEEQHYGQLYEGIADGLEELRRNHPESYKLWPWFVKRAKERFKLQVALGQVMTPGRGAIGFGHEVDITGEGGNVLSQLRAQNQLPPNMDVNKMNFREFEDWLMQWKRDNRESESQGEVVYQYHNGWTMQKLTTPEQLQYEGDEMGHCVGGYAHTVGNGQTIIYSLRDNKGVPHVTMEIAALEGPENLGNWTDPDDVPEDASYNHEYIHPDKHAPGQHLQEAPRHNTWGYHPSGEIPYEIEQIQGNSNLTPKPEYQHMVKEFLDSLRAKGWKFVRSENWYYSYDDPRSEEADGTEPTNAEELDEWYDNLYKPNWKQYQGGPDSNQDPYGLPHQRLTPGGIPFDDVMEHAAYSLLENYDRSSYYTHDWQGLAQATYHAWCLDIYKDALNPDQLERHKKAFEEQIQKTEEKIHEWSDENGFYAVDSYSPTDIMHEFQEMHPDVYEQVEEQVDVELGEGSRPYGLREQAMYDKFQDEHEDEWTEVIDKIRDEANDHYAGDAYKYTNYLYHLVDQNGVVNPEDLPDPNQRHGGLPAYDDLLKKHQTPAPAQPEQAQLSIPGTLSSWGKASPEIQIHPIDEEHNVWFDEDGQQHARFRPAWAKGEDGKMRQTGGQEDSFLDKQGRQGQGWVAYHGTEPIGSLTYVDTPISNMIGTAYVHPDYREQGIFNQLSAPLQQNGKPTDAYVWNNPWLRSKVRSWGR
jgi:PcfJ-like protein